MENKEEVSTEKNREEVSEENKERERVKDEFPVWKEIKKRSNHPCFC